MANDHDFNLIYDGPLLQNGTIDVRELGPALTAIGELVEEANSTLQLGLQSPRVIVTAQFRRGSFLSELRIVCESVVNLFAGDTATAIANLMAILGIAGFLGLLQYIKQSKGRKPKKIIEIEQTTKVRVEFEDGEELETQADVWKLFNTMRIRQLVQKLVAPLKRDGIDKMQVVHQGKPVIDLYKADVPNFNLPTEHEDETVLESDQRLKIVSLSFKPGNKWRVSDGRNTFHVTISDEEFLQKVQSAREVFRNGDVLHARLVTRQWSEGGDLKSDTQIVRVAKHVPIDQEQMTLEHPP